MRNEKLTAGIGARISQEHRNSKKEHLIAAAIMVFIAVGLFLVIGPFIFALIVIITAAWRARDGEKYRYPLTIRFIQ